MARPRKASEPSKSRRPPATTVEARENQLIAMAYDLAEQQISEGTASSQVISHFLKLGTTRERLEQEKLKKENILLNAKAESIQSAARVEELYTKALNSMKTYSGQQLPEDYDED